MFDMTCPRCGEVSPKGGDQYTDIAQVRSATADCDHCGLLILIRRGITQDFHAAIHEEDPRWPKDGRGAGWIEVPG